MWGEPFELHDEDETIERFERLKGMGLTVGALIRYGSSTLGNEGMFLWERPEASARIQSAFVPMTGVVLAVDVDSDPSTDWIMLCLSVTSGTTVIGWAPAELVTTL